MKENIVFIIKNKIKQLNKYRNKKYECDSCDGNPIIYIGEMLMVYRKTMILVILYYTRTLNL